MKKSVLLTAIVVLFTGISLRANEINFQLALFNPIQIAGTNTSVNGVRISLIYGVNEDVLGLDFGMINRVNGDAGAAQIGVVNYVQNEFLGLQYGFYNRAGDMTGLQLGIVNEADTLNGLQIGIININKSGDPYGLLPIVNFSFK